MKRINPGPQDDLVGKRIQLVLMTDDPDPVPPGTQGIVTGGGFVDWPGQGFTQLWVDWDNGRTLSLVSPPDEFLVIE